MEERFAQGIQEISVPVCPGRATTIRVCALLGRVDGLISACTYSEANGYMLPLIRIWRNSTPYHLSPGATHKTRR